MKNDKVKQITDDLSAVLKEAKSMGCTEVKYFHHIPLENIEIVVKALEIQNKLEKMVAELEKNLSITNSTINLSDDYEQAKYQAHYKCLTHLKEIIS